MFLKSIFIFIVILFQTHFIWATKIEIKGKQLYVNDKPFMVKGVCYSGVPVGKDYTYEWEYDRQDHATDFPLIKAMGANCIRTYGSFNQPYALDAAYQHGLYVIIEMAVPWTTDYSNNTTRTQVLNSAKRMVDKFKAHPAVLMWCIGHEVNVNITPGVLNSTTTNGLKTWYPLLNEVAGKIHEWEAPYWHPVTYGEAVANASNFGNWIGATTVGNPVFYSDDAHMQNFDIWGAQTYPGSYFESDFFSTYQSLSSKPLWIAETGCDAFDTRTHTENQEMQATVLNNLWTDVKNNANMYNPANPCVGVTFFSWDDGWWKYSGGSFYTHDTNGTWSQPYFYDYVGSKNMQEEWWGIVSIFPGTYERGLRKAYYTLQSLWTTGNETKELDNFLFRKTSVNIPNPFQLDQDSNTEIWAYLNYPSKINVKIFDYSGKLIREINQTTEYSGYTYRIDWNGKDNNNQKVKTGLYLCKIKAEYQIGDTSEQESQLIKIAVIK